MLTGTITTAKNGIMAMIRIIVPKKLAKTLNHCLKFRGSLLSHVSTSLANRLTILPRGVVSKKPIGPFMILSSIVLCINLEAFNVVKATDIDKRKFPNA